jgi:hypothetical protein
MAINIKSLLPLVVLGGFAWFLSKFMSQPAGPTNELPGYTFPEPGTTGVVTDAAGNIVAENYVVGTAEQAYENAQAILAVTPKTISGIPYTYNDVRQFDINIGQIPAGYGGEMVNYDFFNPATGEYLDIGPHGWAVYKQDFSTLNPTGWALKRGSTAFMGLFHELPQWLS